MKHLKILKEEEYKKVQLKIGSASIEIKMIIDDATVDSPFVKMFTVDDFRGMSYDDIDKKIQDNFNHIATSFSLALFKRIGE